MNTKHPWVVTYRNLCSSSLDNDRLVEVKDTLEKALKHIPTSCKELPGGHKFLKRFITQGHSNNLYNEGIYTVQMLTTS